MIEYIAIAGLLIVIVILWYNFRKVTAQYVALQLQMDQKISGIRKTENTTQRAVLKGKLAEQMYPLMKSCEYVSADMRFIGMPIDYIIFEGLEESRETNPYVYTVTFLDIKTGNASLSKEQRAIKDAIEKGRIQWVTLKLNV